MRQKRFYGLFYKVGARWVRLFPKRAYHKETAIRMFQGILLTTFFEGKRVELRPVPVKI